MFQIAYESRKKKAVGYIPTQEYIYSLYWSNKVKGFTVASTILKSLKILRWDAWEENSA